MPFKEPTSAAFLEYFPRGWNRLEGRSRQNDFALALSASTADPLWAVGRQWQLLELKGEEGGSPIQVELRYEEAPLNRIALGDGPFHGTDGTPIEVQVERERVDWDWRLRIRAGQHFERLVRLDPTFAPTADALIDSLRLSSPITMPAKTSNDFLNMDYATRRFVAMMQHRVIDGHDLLTKINNHVPLGISSDLQTKFSDWYGTLYSQAAKRASDAWVPEQLDYTFQLQPTDTSLPGPLRAPSYRNGSVDWDAFVLEQASTHALKPRDTLQLTPVHVTFAGQPMSRWWAFEDYAVNLAALDIAKTDLPKAILTEFALRFGDDWFVVPVTATPNSLVRVRSLRIRDSFGQFTDLEPARDISPSPLARWQVFALAPATEAGESADFLYVPPVSVGREESPVIDEVRFAKDEDANVVFAIEHIVPNGLGEPTRGFAAHLERLRRGREQRGANGSPAGNASDQASESAASTAPIQYLLSTKVPANWIPFIATDAYNLRDGLPQGAVKLQRAAMVATDDEDARQLIQGLSRLLQPDQDAPVNWIEEEAVGREGARVELRRQRMRSATGETYVWLGRKIGVGKGEARGGLRFDLVRERTENIGT